jgi:hypothetical protein
LRDPGTDLKVEAAIKMAREHFMWLKRHGWFLKKSGLDPDAELRHAAHALICGLPDEIMPAHLRSYVARVLSKAPEGLKRTYSAGRDQYLLEALYDTIRLDFPATRNDATRDKGTQESACSIVQKALARVGVHMEERTVEDIWSNRPEKSG